MKFKESAYTPKARGKIGGNKFSANRYGPYSSLKPRTNYSHTEPQKKVTAQMGGVSRLWSNNLTEAQYDAWNKFCYKFKKKDSSGNIFFPAPRDIFMSCNINLLEVCMPVIFDPPDKHSVQIYKTFELELSYDIDNYLDIKLFFDPSLKNDTRIEIFATMQLKLCNFFFKDRWFKKIGYIDSSFRSGDSIQKLYASVFPLPALPAITAKPATIKPIKIAFRLKSVSSVSGFASPVIQTSASHIPE